MRQTSSTLFPENSCSQSVSSISSEALTKSAYEYFHIGRFTEDLGGFLWLMTSEMPLWSEFASGGMTVHFSKEFILDTKAKSIRVALLLEIILVGSCTT